ncbi:DUF305 domain-containing protein [Brachyspira hampsonii]|uniref:DUF305 domain-containing protein n=1 Tax=Brachyspira hampsonii TaxID=1287055 RepID=A0A1E5NFL4_9SPIR|nr:DUF305 domain-containing protein [Brachyspira hampsonii]OEJ14945.1 DUF305 domain-containing protein [Brachyspira hampsonii]
MKQIITIFIVLMSAFIISCGQKTSDNTDNHSSHSMDSMHSKGSEIIDLMHAPMMEQPFQKTKNIDADFLVNMIPHHQGAIISSKKLLETTTNEALITLANNIIAEQEKEVSEFTDLVTELKNKNTSYEDIDTSILGDEMEKIMNNMMKDMSSIKAAGDNDIDFLKGMIPHHQAAVDVSKKILEYTKDDKIKEIANRIVTAQEKEINDMNNMLNNY